MSEPKTYTASDIERYHRGEMPPAERHLLEKAALDDPFLADMLEGYTFASSAPADLQMLQNRLQLRIEKDNKNRTAVIWMPWLKIAAVFLIVAGGWFLFRTFSTPDGMMVSKNSVARKEPVYANKDSVSPPVQAIAPALKTDSLSTLNDVALNEPRHRKKANPVAGQGRVTTFSQTDKQPADNEAGYLAGTATGLKADIQKKDSAPGIAGLTARSSVPSAATPNDTIRNLNIVLEPLDQSYSEVIVTTAKPKKQRSYQPAVAVDTLEPEQGWQSFNDYVAENLKAPEEIREKKALEGEVELSFSVDKEGNPTKIKVTKPLCAKCDTEAIRLLKEGPKWKGRKGKVKIRFPLSP